MLFSHMIACLYYVVDAYLIRVEYFGPISLNPNLYYQGDLVCYTPIWELTEANRYNYAFYYSISLLSTIAYGDIVPKNYIENVLMRLYRQLSLCIFIYQL